MYTCRPPQCPPALPSARCLDHTKRQRGSPFFFGQRAGAVTLTRICVCSTLVQMRFLTDELMLSVYDVVRFPAYFSCVQSATRRRGQASVNVWSLFNFCFALLRYPLDKIIQSRVAFLKERGLSVSIWGLSTVLTLSDAEFATELAQVSPEVYGSFKKAFASRAKQQRGTMKASATVAKSDTKAATIDAEPQTRGLLSDADLMGPRSDEPADEPTWFGLPPSNSPQSKPRRGSIGSFFKGRFSPAKLFPLD